MFEYSSKALPLTFVMGGKIIQVDFSVTGSLSPTTTVLNYLRSLSDRKGTKEGCAEGDCGACTIVLGEAGEDGKIHYRAVDSCLLFLPMVHGKQVITVEDLREPDGKFHPVQTAMVENFGSQCGYCTPGFIMSMFALYKNIGKPSREEIENALTGNLCRCTGYRSIIEAMAKACVHRSIDHFTREEPQILDLLRSIPNRAIHIKNDSQEYIRPASLGEALSLKHQHPEAVVISGATDIALRVTKNFEVLRFIIDISDVPETRLVEEDGLTLRIGSGVTLSSVIPMVARDFPALSDMLRVFGSQQIRNVATLGGNLGTASPIGDTLPVLIAYGARVTLESLNGRRELPLDDYFTGYRKTLRKNDELISSIILPKPPARVHIKSYKVSKRKDLDISTVSGGFRLELDGDRAVSSVVLAYGGMAERPQRAHLTENFLAGKRWERGTIDEAMSLIENDFAPISDARSSAALRRVAARNLLLKFWSETSSNGS